MEFMGESMVIAMGRPWQSTAVVAFNQQLFNQSVFTGLKAAKTTREFYKINAELTEEQVIEKVANSYFEVYKDRKSTRLNSSHVRISYAVFCLKKKKKNKIN